MEHPEPPGLRALMGRRPVGIFKQLLNNCTVDRLVGTKKLGGNSPAVVNEGGELWKGHASWSDVVMEETKGDFCVGLSPVRLP